MAPPPERKAAFRAVNYDVTAALNPADQTLTARAIVDFVATGVSREVEVELHPNLSVSSVTADGRPVSFLRDSDTPLKLKATLPEPATTGKTVKLAFDYSGPLANEENSPVKGVRLAYIGADGAYLLLPARWFPLTGYPSNRFTGVFNLKVPANFAVAGTGKTTAPTQVGSGQILYKFICDRPAPVGSFVAGNLQLTPVKAEGLEIPVYTQPSAVQTAKEYGEALGRVVTFFSSEFGPLTEPNLAIAQLPDGTVSGFAAPGLLLVSQREWRTPVNDRILARLAAEQWWGDRVLPASSSDVWLSDGLSRYSEVLYAQAVNGSQGRSAALDDCAVGALMQEDAAPIAQASRLDPFTSAYLSVVVNKGAMVFHMLRVELGDKPFEELLQTYYSQFAGKTATLDDFEKLVAAALAKLPSVQGQPPLNLTAFFTQWLNSTGVPEFHLDYIIYRTQKGFKVVGKVKQELETLNMPLEIRVDTEGNPEYKTIHVVGTDSEFTIATFGRPKPGGIRLDPNNNILKSSPQLRVRAMIAQGEDLASLGQFFDAIQEYQRALGIQRNNSLASFRMGEVLFYQKNYQAAATAFRDSIDGDLDPSYKWVEVWSHIYLGKIFDLTGSRDRALNEYQKAVQTHDNTDGAQAEAARYLQKPYSGEVRMHPGGD